MNTIFKTGDKKEYTRTVSEKDIAEFETGIVHRFSSTFAVARDAEWACRLFVLEMKEIDEEGIGTFVHVEHHSPALVGAQVLFVSEVKSITKNEIICSFKATSGGRLVATGETGQKILKKEKLEKIATDLQIKK
jgi:fluoroacetyl-CoA thioesterase